MTPILETIRAALEAAINEAEDAEMIQKALEISDENGSALDIEIWGMKIDKTPFGQAIVKSTEGRIVVDVDPKIPAFFERTSQKIVDIPSETERLLLECDPDRAYDFVFADEAEKIRSLSSSLGVVILPDFRKYGSTDQVTYGRNDLRAA
tara:strand:- start:62 stop:511 length:450 start_codon:yes stop_codon:yes gene_type:complete